MRGLAAVELGLRDAILAAMMSTYLLLVCRHAGNIYIYGRLTRPEFISGQLHQTAEYAYGVSSLDSVAVAAPLTVLAVVEPCPVTIGFAAGPLMLALTVRRMRAHDTRLRERETHTEETLPDATDAD